jgi:hypothetical protein
LTARLDDLRTQLYASEGQMTGLKDIGATVLGFGLEFSGGDERGHVRVEILKSGMLSHDSRQLLRRQFADQLGVAVDRVRLAVADGHFESDSLFLESFHPKLGNSNPLELLNGHSELHARVLLPGFMAADSVPVWEDRLEHKYHFEQDRDRISMQLDSTVVRFVVEVY